jgi:glycine/D-amino acid oxidase-like deaminating enzyme
MPFSMVQRYVIGEAPNPTIHQDLLVADSEERLVFLAGGRVSAVVDSDGVIHGDHLVVAAS